MGKCNTRSPFHEIFLTGMHSLVYWRRAANETILSRTVRAKTLLYNSDTILHLCFLNKTSSFCCVLFWICEIKRSTESDYGCTQRNLELWHLVTNSTSQVI